MKVLGKVIHANIWGTLKPHVPNLDQLSADFAYKVTYLGKYKNFTETEDTLVNNEVFPIDNLERKSNKFLVVYPNPNNGQFHVKSAAIFYGVKIYSDKDEIEDLNCKSRKKTTVLFGNQHRI